MLDDEDVCFLSIDTLEGRMRADPGDWIIQGVKGEFYPCKPDIFEATYEPFFKSIGRSGAQGAPQSEIQQGCKDGRRARANSET